MHVELLLAEHLLMTIANLFSTTVCQPLKYVLHTLISHNHPMKEFILLS